MRSLPSAVIAMDAEGCLTALNPRAEQLLGTTAEQAIGRPYPEVLGPSFSDRVLSLFLHVSRRGESGEPRVLEMALPGGRRATLLANLGPLRDGSGKLTGFLLAIEERTSVTDVNELAAKAEHLETTLKRYVGDLVGGFAGARPSFTQVGGSVQTISVIHADVRGFTTVAEVLPPEEVMALLLRYHSAAVASLDELRATMSRFIGDAILAFWNAPEPCSDHARVATQGALALRRAVEAVGSDLRYGIGIHTGEALVGNLGSEQFMNYTAIGDTVNVAARLQGEARPGEVVCSAATLTAAGAGIRTTPLGPLVVKGRKKPVDAFRVEGIEV